MTDQLVFINCKYEPQLIAAALELGAVRRQGHCSAQPIYRVLFDSPARREQRRPPLAGSNSVCM
jgi:hypothetical protein